MKSTKQLEDEERARYAALMETEYQKALQSGLPDETAMKIAIEAVKAEAKKTIARILNKTTKSHKGIADSPKTR